MPGSPMDPPNGGSRIPTGDPGGDLSVGSPVQKGGDPGDLVARVRELVSSGWSVRVRRRRNGSLFLAARKYINGKRREVYVAGVSEEELQRLRELGLLTTISSSRKPRRRIGSGSPRGGVGGSSHSRPTGGPPRSAGASGAGSGPSSAPLLRQNHPRGDSARTSRQNGGSQHSALPADKKGGPEPELMIHRLVLKFSRPWVSPLYLSSFGKVRWVERSKQRVLKLRLGKHRTLTIQVNPNGTAQVFLEASEAPLSIEEFVGFARFYLIELFGRLTGRAVSLSDFVVLAAPEFNLDLPGVNLVEGLGKSLTLEEYAEGVIRVYRKGFATTLPNGGTRVEFRAEGLEGRSLRDVVDSVVAQVELPRLVHDLRKELELVRSGVTQLQASRGTLVEAVAAKLANLLDLFFRRLEARLQQWFREVIDKVVEAVEGYIDALRKRVEELEAENRRLREELRRAAGYSSTLLRQNPELGILTRRQARKEDLYEKLLELAKPNKHRPALIKVNEAQGWVGFSDDLWRYIMRRLPDGSRRGLDREILEKVQAHEGPEVVELLLMIQRRGRVSIQEALEVLSRGEENGSDSQMGKGRVA